MTRLPTRASVREQKAEALDVFVKAELARKKERDAAQMARLKALRVARDQRQADAAADRRPGAGKPVTRKTLHLPRSS